MVEGGGAWKDGHVCFFVGAGSVPVRRRGPSVGRSEIRSWYRCSTAQKSNVQSRLLNCKHGSQFLSVLFQLTFPSVIITTTNQPSLRPRPLIPRRRHCDLPNFGQRPAEGESAQGRKSGARKGVACDQALTSRSVPSSGAVLRVASGSPDQVGGLRYLPLSYIHPTHC
jgi:hypothetical protein